MNIYTCQVEGVWNKSILSNRQKEAKDEFQCVYCKYYGNKCATFKYMPDIDRPTITRERAIELGRDSSYRDAVEDNYDYINSLRDDGVSFNKIVKLLLESRKVNISHKTLKKHLAAIKEERGCP